MTPEQLALRARIFEAFASTGGPPDLPDAPDLRALAEQHVVVLDEAARVVMAHPFAAPPPHRAAAELTRVVARSGPAPGVWHGNCAWDGLGIAAALGLDGAVVESGGITTDEAAFFHVGVPARQWWDDIGHT
ncbi:MAG TPA: hypothetical protein VF549_18595 [Solirubrobacteraceae bacterium]